MRQNIPQFPTIRFPNFQSRKSTTRHLLLATAVASIAAWGPSASADQTKKDVPDNLNLGSSWVSGTAPAATDMAIFDSTLQNNFSFNLGTNLTWQGIRILTPD